MKDHIVTMNLESFDQDVFARCKSHFSNADDTLSER
jgi:hypothetical protein